MDLYWVLQGCFNHNDFNFDNVSKIDFYSLLKMKVIWNKDYDVIVFVYDVPNKISSRDSKYFLDVIMWPKFRNSSTEMWTLHLIKCGSNDSSCSVTPLNLPARGKVSKIFGIFKDIFLQKMVFRNVLITSFA